MSDYVPGTFTKEPIHHTIEKKRPKEEKIEEMEVEIPDLKEWNQRELPEDFFMVMEGKRRTGKSTFAKWLLQYHQDKFSLVWCMTNTKASGFWQEFVGDAFTFDTWYPSAVHKLIQRNDEHIKKFGEKSQATRKLAATLIILDDVISSGLHNDPTFMRLAVEGRHHLISVIIMTQDTKAISPKVRDNADVAIIFNQKTFRNKESVWGDFLNDVDKKVGFSLISKYAVEHDALVAVQTNLNGDIKRNFFKSTGDKTHLEYPDYTLGGPTQKSMIIKERKEKAIKDRQKARDAPYAKENPEEIKKLGQKEMLK